MGALSRRRCWPWTPRLLPALDADTDPGRPVPSAEHANVVIHVPRTPPRQSAEFAVGEKRLVRGTFPHVAPFILRRRLTRPLSRYSAVGSDRVEPIPGRGANGYTTPTGQTPSRSSLRSPSTPTPTAYPNPYR